MTANSRRSPAPYMLAIALVVLTQGPCRGDVS